MKNNLSKVLFIFLTIFMFIPKVNANVICHDGTESKSCKTCEVGCCSNHGGCEEAKSKESTQNLFLIGAVIVIGGICAAYYLYTNAKLRKKKKENGKEDKDKEKNKDKKEEKANQKD